MGELTIKTNNQWREIISGYDLTEKERLEFDYMADVYEGSFVRYKGQVYSMDQFMRLDWRDESPFPSMWHGFHGDSYFSGVLIHLSSCGDACKLATYYS